MPWFDEESRLLRRHVRQRERQYRKNGNDQNRDACMEGEIASIEKDK